jgi:signal transduction histidine kinase/CheY-like chemotaxis protein
MIRHRILFNNLSSDENLVSTACAIGMFGVLAGIITRVMMGAYSGLLIGLAAFQVLVLAVMGITSRCRALPLGKSVIIAPLCFVLMPPAFFFFGGAGGASYWYFALSLVIVFLLTRGWACAVLAAIQIGIVIACHYIDFLFPGIAIRLSGGAEQLERIRFVDRIQGYLMVGLAVGVIAKLQGYFSRSAKFKGEAAARDLEMARQTTRAIFDCNPHINILLDSNFQVIDCNSAALEFLGFSSKEDLFANFADRVVSAIPEFQADGKPSVPLSDRLQTAVKEGSVRFETELHLPDGKRILDVEFSRIPYGDSFAIVGYIIDLTMEREAERELLRRGWLLAAVNNIATILASDSAFDDILQKSMATLATGAGLDRIYVWQDYQIGDEKIYVPVSGWYNDTGRSREMVNFGTAMSYINAIPEWEEKFSKDESVNGPVRTLSPNEQEVMNYYGVLSILVVPIFLQNKFWGFFSFDDCHSEKTFSETEVSILRSGGLLIAGAMLRHEMTVKISDTASTLNTIISKYNGVIWSVDRNRIITCFSGRYLAKIGVTSDFLEGRSIDLVDAKSQYYDIVQNISDTLFDGQERDWISDFGFAVFHSHVVPQYDEDGMIAGVVGSTDDITETIRLQRDLKEAMEDAQAASRAKSEFLSNMSHEIRTPMNAIIGMTSIGKSSDDIDRKNYAFGKIEDASTHLLRIINDILDMSKIEAGKFELSVAEFNLEKMLLKLSDVVAFRINEKKQKLMVHIDRGVPRMMVGDDQRLTQVIVNLLGNAVKFTPDGGFIFVKVMYVREKNDCITLRFEVRDTGIGISAEQQARLFKSFEQAESGTTRKFGGTGLGLVISKHIVEMMGGDIWIDSELGKGSTFCFTINVKRCKGEFSRKALADPEIAGVRVLVVDDMAEAREYFTDIAMQIGFQCDAAGTGDEALALAAGNACYDICFIDWGMQDSNRLELPRRIKELGGGKTMVIAMIPMVARTSMEAEARLAGIDGFLSKPIFLSAVANYIDEYLGREIAREEEIVADKIWGENFRNSRILLVEDVEINREIVYSLLEPTQLNIASAEDGEVAVRMYRDAPDAYDMIFMDVQMPVMDGFMATQLIREFEQEQEKETGRARRVPIVAMTASVFREDMERCIRAGMDDHLGKPLDINEVIEKLRKYLE